MYRNTRLFSVISYITWIGWIIAFIARDKNDQMVRHHLNQALALNIVGVLVSVGTNIGGTVAKIAMIISFLALVLTIMGIYRAAKLSDEPLPIVGNFSIF